MKPLMEKKEQASDKRANIAISLDTKKQLDELRHEYNATHDEVIAAMLKFYDTHGR